MAREGDDVRQLYGCLRAQRHRSGARRDYPASRHRRHLLSSRQRLLEHTVLVFLHGQSHGRSYHLRQYGITRWVAQLLVAVHSHGRRVLLVGRLPVSRDQMASPPPR